MNIDRAVLTLAGSMVLLSLALAWLVNPYWLAAIMHRFDRFAAPSTAFA